LALARPPPRRPVSGSENFPGATTSARVTVASFNVAADRLSHVAPKAEAADVAARIATNKTTNFVLARTFHPRACIGVRVSVNVI
jgi:hypothetical protein